MKSLYDYDVLVYEVFHRCWHILEYIEKHPDMDELEKEVISNTIMDALVYKGLIDKDEETLDLSNLCIRKSKNYYKYQEKTNATGIPLWLKEKLRAKKVKISAGMPITMFLAKPPGTTHYCLYDVCHAISTVFEDFTNISAIYDSPTRKGARLTDDRPFLEVNLDGEPYLINVLLKRMYKKSFFAKNFNMEITFTKSNKDFNDIDKVYFNEKVAKESDNFEDTLFALRNFLSLVQDFHSTAEMYYEIEQSKINEPEAWQKLAYEEEKFKAFEKQYFIKI